MLLAALVLVQASVSFPDWDVDRACGRLPPHAAKPCVEQEQAAYDALKDEWPRLTEVEKVRLVAAGNRAETFRYSVARQSAEGDLAVDASRRPVQVPSFRR